MKPRSNDDTKFELTLTFFDAKSNSCSTKKLEKSSTGGSMNWIGDDLGNCNQLHLLSNVQITGMSEAGELSYKFFYISNMFYHFLFQMKAYSIH